MKYIDLQEAFEIEINKLYDGAEKPRTITTEYFLNSALDKFWKTRYSALNYKKEGFEQTQKRIDDLRTLVSEITVEPTAKNNKEYIVDLPEDYLLLLGDTAGIVPADGIENKCWDKNEDDTYVIHRSDTIEGKIETVDRIIDNSLSEYHLRYTKAKPIKLIIGNNIKLITDGQYKVIEYTMQYLRKPIRIDIHKNPFDEYTDMPEHTHIEIVKLAAQLYIENQADNRYQTYTQEVIPSME